VNFKKITFIELPFILLNNLRISEGIKTNSFF